MLRGVLFTGYQDMRVIGLMVLVIECTASTCKCDFPIPAIYRNIQYVYGEYVRLLLVI